MPLAPGGQRTAVTGRNLSAMTDMHLSQASREGGGQQHTATEPLSRPCCSMRTCWCARVSAIKFCFSQRAERSPEEARLALALLANFTKSSIASGPAFACRECRMQALSDDLLLHLLRHADGQTLLRARGVSHTWHTQSDDDSLWAALCQEEGLARMGSSRPTARTYRTWQQTWLDSRCAECAAAYMFKVNLDGGSSTACTFGGAKVALCADCSCLAVASSQPHHYRGSGERTATLLPRLTRRFAPEGEYVAQLVGKKLEGALKEARLNWRQVVAEGSEGRRRRDAPAGADGD